MFGSCKRSISVTEDKKGIKYSKAIWQNIEIIYKYLRTKNVEKEMENFVDCIKDSKTQ